MPLHGRYMAGTWPLYDRYMPFQEGLSKSKIGEFLGGNAPLNVATLSAFVRSLDFSRLSLDAALRYFVSLFKLPGEAQCIDRLLLAFSGRWSQQNGASATLDGADGAGGGSGGGSGAAAAGEGGGAIGTDVAYVLAFSIIMLNTDLHSPQVAPPRSRHTDPREPPRTCACTRHADSMQPRTPRAADACTEDEDTVLRMRPHETAAGGPQDDARAVGAQQPRDRRRG